MAINLATGILALALSGASPAPADPVGVYRDWSKHCEVTSEGDIKQCYLAEAVHLDLSAEPVLRAMIGPSASDPKTLVLVLTAPLGVNLPAGLELEVPKLLKRERHDFQTCSASGCHAVIDVTPARLAAFLKAGFAKVRVLNRDNRAMEISLSLRGIKAGLAAL